jgi:hypothetical protein
LGNARYDCAIVRNIGDFSGWKDHHSYQRSFERLMRDLRVETSGQ